jgi:hypothetical protein
MLREYLMIVEVRHYKVKPGLRDKFLEFFQSQAVPLQQSIGMGILGPLVDLEDGESFTWLRTFPSPEARECMKRELYEGDPWRNELAAIALPMLESYRVTLTATIPGVMYNLPDQDGDRSRS